MAKMILILQTFLLVLFKMVANRTVCSRSEQRSVIICFGGKEEPTMGNLLRNE